MLQILEMIAGATVIEGFAAAAGGAGAIIVAPLVIPIVIGVLGVGVALTGYKIHLELKKRGDLEISSKEIDDVNKAIDKIKDILKKSFASGTNQMLNEELEKEKEKINKEGQVILNFVRKIAKKSEKLGKFFEEVPEKEWKNIKLATKLIEKFQQVIKESEKRDKLFSGKAKTFFEFAQGIRKSREEYIRSLIEDKKHAEEIRKNKKEIGELGETILILGGKNKKIHEQGNEQLEEANAKTEEERRGREGAEVRAETLASLIERFQNGELPASALSSIDVSQFLPSTSKQK
ncbi:hypothetical protein [Wolbachia endosymbiont of Pentidionis agamae]|uniref:hypothetical protein n=1 Tax=Wolbachia endosymbiont of Pentidionis agamae TaxID=3110435 RepID=UPI002FD77D78